ncbi:unnamed protein product [Rotaria sordida]|uniref:Uncharacterized protein n=1 Tax=Rotaria sordida TaxID=392033 RepID=A0A820BQA6_9BILA|nr:unnamed protein product [Rotaria sordida]
MLLTAYKDYRSQNPPGYGIAPIADSSNPTSIGPSSVVYSSNPLGTGIIAPSAYLFDPNTHEKINKIMQIER